MKERNTNYDLFFFFFFLQFIPYNFHNISIASLLDVSVGKLILDLKPPTIKITCHIPYKSSPIITTTNNFVLSPFLLPGQHVQKNFFRIQWHIELRKIVKFDNRATIFEYVTRVAIFSSQRFLNYFNREFYQQ